MENTLTLVKSVEGGKSPAEIRRDMAKMPVVLDALNAAERSVFLATTAKPIGEYAATDLAAELQTALVFIAKDTGYRNFDKDEQAYMTIRVAEILKRHYPQLTMKEFRIAFEMCITGGLDNYLPKRADGQPERGHYQQFNAEYVCKVLNAYKRLRVDIVEKAVDAVPKPAPARDIEKEREAMNRTRRDCVQAFEFYKTNGYMPEMSPIAEMLYYNILSDAGLVQPIEVTPDEQRVILQRTLNAYAVKGMAHDYKRVKKEGNDASEIQPSAFSLARRKALKEAFASMCRKGTDLSQLIIFE